MSEVHSMIDLLRRNAASSPDAVALTFLTDGETPSRTLTYAELEEKARAIAAYLQGWNVTGQRLLLLYPPGLDFVIAFFACLFAGAVAVPAYPPRAGRDVRKNGLDRLRAIARDAGIGAVLAGDAVMARAAEIEAAAPELGRVRWLATSDLIDGAGAWREPDVGTDTLAFLQFTSGSTAEPRGVMVRHKNLLHNLAYIHDREQNDATSVSVSWLPVYHDMGLVEGILSPIFGGYPGYVMAPAAFLQRPARWLEAITRYGGTNAGGPDFAFDLCTRKVTPSEQARLDLTSWRVAYSGSEPVRFKTLELFHARFAPAGFRWRAFYPVYGLAEATLVVASGRQNDEAGALALDAAALACDRAEVDPEGGALRVASCGPWSCGTEVAIVDPESRQRRAPRAVGEIWVRSPSVAAGYWGRPELSKATFAATLDDGSGPWLRTGDLGFIASDELHVTGRIKDVIILRGRKLYPQDIERTVADASPAIRAAHVAAFAIGEGEHETLAVVAEIDPRADLSSLDDELEARLLLAVSDGHEARLDHLFLVAPGSIPKTTSGKIRRGECRRLLREGRFTRDARVDGAAIASAWLEAGA